MEQLLAGGWTNSNKQIEILKGVEACRDTQLSDMDSNSFYFTMFHLFKIMNKRLLGAKLGYDLNLCMCFKSHISVFLHNFLCNVHNIFNCYYLAIECFLILKLMPYLFFILHSILNVWCPELTTYKNL